MFNKTATRLPEAMWVSFEPSPATPTHPTPSDPPGVWTMDKIGTSVSPTAVIAGGSQYQHSVWKGLSFTSSTATEATAVFESLDAGKLPCVPHVCLWWPSRCMMRVRTAVCVGDSGVVSPITDDFPHGNALPYPLTPLSEMPTGFAWNLHNNLWYGGAGSACDVLL